jgi:hypothetical protein
LTDEASSCQSRRLWTSAFQEKNEDGTWFAEKLDVDESSAKVRSFAWTEGPQAEAGDSETEYRNVRVMDETDSVERRTRGERAGGTYSARH